MAEKRQQPQQLIGMWTVLRKVVVVVAAAAAVLLVAAGVTLVAHVQ